MGVRVVTVLGILVPLLAARMVRGEATPWWVVFIAAFVAFGIARVVERCLARGQSQKNRIIGWTLLIGGSALSCGYAVVGSTDRLWAKLARPPAPAPGWEHHAGAWKDVAVGNGGACAVKNDGTVWCWGDPKYGWPTAETDVSLHDMAQIAIGTFAICATRIGGDVWCWRPSEIGKGAPAPIGITRTSKVTVGFGHACTLDLGGAVWCWGKIADRTLAVPTKIALTTARDVASGHDVSCAVLAAGEVSCWGLTDFDRPDLPRTPSAEPKRVDGAPNASRIALGPSTACVVEDEGQVYCWGSGIVSSPTPIRMPGLSDVARVAIGPRHLCAAMRSKHVRCTGKNDRGQLGLPDLRDASFATVAGLSDITVIAAGEHATCAIDTSPDGELVCWGVK